MKSWTFLQKMNLGLGVVFLAQAIGGMVVNPDFAVGDNATSEVFLWMDWNGWHALSGHPPVVNIPGRRAARRPVQAVWLSDRCDQRAQS